MNTRMFPMFLICLVAVLGNSLAAVVGPAAAGGGASSPQGTRTTMNANLIVDDEFKLYADGQLIGSNEAWNQARRLTIPLTTVVVAIEAKNTGKGPQGIRASFDGARLVTDAKHWKCRASNAADWLKPSFDDSTWPAAKEVAYDGNVNAIANKEIVNVAAKWIWSGSSEDDTAYCRAILDIDGYLMVDDKTVVFADGKQILTNSEWSKVNSFTVPGNTHVIAISGENSLGGPYGIRGSFHGKKLVTSDQGRWRCENALVPNWEKPSFNDKAWPVAKTVSHTFKGKTNIDAAAKWIWGPKPEKTYCRAFLHMYATLRVDDHMKLYADGILMGTGEDWKKGMRFRMPGETQVVAIHATNTGGPYGIKGYFAAGRLVTGAASWKCSPTLAPNWNTPAFDDSSWAAAKEVEYTGQKDQFNGYKVEGHGSKWIWAAGGSKDAFCRGLIRPAPTVVTGLEDTNPQGNEAGVGQDNGNADVATENQEQENQVQGNEANQIQANQNQANQNEANQNQANQNQANQNQANQNQANQVQNTDGNFVEDNLPIANNGDTAGFNTAPPQVHRVLRKKRPLRGRFRPAGANVGVKHLRGQRVFRNKGQRLLRKNHPRRVQNNFGLPGDENLINIL